jgi:pimeloyl-ACP methyl ester carboxylesterase
VIEHAFVTDDGVRIVYRDHGPADGQVVVLCHGLAAAARQFANDGEFFAAQGFRVLVPDLRGHGDSGKAAGGRVADYSIARMAADLVGMLDDAQVGAVHWVGNSLGGIIALSLLASHPSRLRTLATFGTAFSLHLPRFGARVIPLSYRLLGPRLTAWITAAATSRSPAARRLVRQVLRKFDPDVGHAVAANLVRYDLIGNAVATRVPMLMLRGGRDRQVNSALGPTLRAMRGLPHFALVEVPEGGHCANLDATEAVRRELMGFWTAHG